MIRSAFMDVITIQICCAKDYILVQGQLIEELVVVASGTVELINNRGMVCRTYTKGSFFGEKVSVSRSRQGYKTCIEATTILTDTNTNAVRLFRGRPKQR